MVKKTYQINTTRGVDLSSSPLNVAPSRASYMCNMINDGGINKKRHGWNEIALFEDVDGKALPINGIWEYVRKYVHPDTNKYVREKSLIVYAGTEFFKCSEDFTAQEKILVEAGTNINGEKCKAYYKDGLLWIIGCGDYLVYDGTSIVRVEDSEYAYAPVTTMNITEPTIEEARPGEAFEDVNLLTNRRVNKIIGKLGSYNSTYYNLDGLINFSKPIRISVEIRPAGTAVNDNEVSVSAEYKDSGQAVTDIVTIIYELDSIEKGVQYGYTKAICGDKEVRLFNLKTTGTMEYKEDYKAAITFYNFSSGQVTFYSSVPSPSNAYNNITVEYYADYERSVELTKSAVFTQANGVDLLLVANRDNAIFYSGLDSADCEYSFGYLPVEKFITFGSDREPITAIVPMSDSVGVFKGESFYRVLFSFNSDSETYEAEYVPQITEAIDTNGCVNQFISCNVNGDTLIFDGAGVYGIEYSSSQRSLKLRSSNISKAFKQYSKDKLESAIACHHEGRYYLFIDGDVYIADSRFKVYESNRLDTSFEYEWWLWDNCPATVVCSINGNLYMGRENGKIAVFDKEYKDRELLIAKSSANEVSCENDEFRHSILTFDKSLGVKVGDTVKVSGAYQQIGWKVPIIKEGEYARAESLKIDGGYIGKKIILGSTNKECEIIDFVADDISSYFIINTTFSNTESIYCSIENKKFTIDEYEGQLCLMDGVGVVCLAEFDNFEVIIERSNNVECEYHTPALDLGSNLSLKILNQLAITVSSDTEGQIEVGYQTNSNNRFMQRSIGAGFDFNDFNFNTLSFDCFYKTHVKRVFERNFNYILFKLASSSDKAFGVENFSCVYKSNNKLLKGDR